MTKKTFLGTDVSKDTLDFSLMFENQPEKYFDLKVSNDLKGYETMRKWLRQFKVNLDSLIIIMEHTGVYTLDFMCYLDQNQLEFALFPGLEIKRSLGIKRGKNDKVDARRIAYYGYLIRHKLKATQMPSEQMMKLKQLLTARNLMVKHKTSLKNSLKVQTALNKVTEMDFLRELFANQINSLEADIKKIEKEMKSLVSNTPQMKKNFELLLSITGIGEVIALSLIVYTNNFSAFPSARHFMSYIGVAPFDDESGKYQGKRRVCSLANKRLKSLLHNGVASSIMHDPEARAYYLRKIEAGKHKRQAANAVAGKLILRIFAVIKRGTPFVSIYSQNISHKKVA